ncbi:unnamed protein product [marine sediment metagenome]|uniref:Uncharacterized protein n=1 Tax=marine sediment metagenome TaxID=412755 RepID=X1UMF4_9ZZZZ
MNKLQKAYKKVFLKALIAQALIREKDGRYYSTCAMGEEITIELKEIFGD